MAITWESPLPGGRVGPGIQISLFSDFAGTVPVGSQWQIVVTPLEQPGWTMYDAILTTASTGCVVTIGERDGQMVIDTPATSDVQQGGNVRMAAALVAPDQTVLDSDEATFVLDVQTGVPFSITKAIDQKLEAVLPEVLKQQIEFTYTLSIWSVLGAALPELADLLQLVGPGLLVCIENDFLLTGEGFAHRGSDPNVVSAIGFQWEIVERAPGIGLDESAPDQVAIGAVAFSVMLRDRDGNPYYREYYAERGVRGSHTWGINDYVYRLAYFVTPGVTVRLCWLAIG